MIRHSSRTCIWPKQNVTTNSLISKRTDANEVHEIVWDKPKREANLFKHGVDFADIDEAFFLNALIGDAMQGRRFAIGLLDDVIVVIFMTLGAEGVSIVSAPPASKTERRLLS